MDEFNNPLDYRGKLPELRAVTTPDKDDQERYKRIVEQIREKIEAFEVIFYNPSPQPESMPDGFIGHRDITGGISRGEVVVFLAGNELRKGDPVVLRSRQTGLTHAYSLPKKWPTDGNVILVDFMSQLSVLEADTVEQVSPEPDKKEAEYRAKTEDRLSKQAKDAAERRKRIAAQNPFMRKKEASGSNIFNLEKYRS